MTRPTRLELPSQIKACLLDLDGVLVPTVALHRQAWAELFETALAAQPQPVAPYTEADYFTLVDGRPRYDGVRAVLRSRGITLPEGSPDDPVDAWTVCGLGNRKDRIFQAALARGIEAYPGSLKFLAAAQAAGLPLAVVTSSKNAAPVLAACGISDRFVTVVDGNLAAERGLAGKPAPDCYLAAAAILDVDPAHAVVFEDALGGVAAGRAGGFGTVVGVDRGVGAEALRRHGADLVVTDLAELVGEVAAASAAPVPAATRSVEPWALRESTPDGTATARTLFAVGNGYLGLRGGYEEDPDLADQAFVNGFHETWPIVYPETAFGLAQTGQTIVPVPNPVGLRLEVDGEAFEPRSTTVLEHDRHLDLRSGRLDRHLRWRTTTGVTVTVDASRLVSFARREVAALSYRVTVDRSAQVQLTSSLVAPSSHRNDDRPPDPRRPAALREPTTVESIRADGDRITMSVRTRAAGLPLAVGVSHRVSGAPGEANATTTADRAEFRYRADLAPGVPLTLTKVAAVVDAAAHAPTSDTLRRCLDLLDTLEPHSFDDLSQEQADWVAAWWQDADIEVTTSQPDDSLQGAIRWNLFQALQASARGEGRGVAAKGVSGAGYDGHYFWDTEISVFPFLLASRPQLARNELLWRHSTLPQARARAAELGHRGALFPWRTIDGREASAYFEAGTAQYHIDADVAHAVVGYLTATEDGEFLAGAGIDLLTETARFWVDFGFYGSDGGFHLHNVTGPDEYTALVDDNVYTNVMARANLTAAADALDRLRTTDPAAYGRAIDRLSLTATEPDRWRQAAAAMTILFDQERGIHPQDARFLEREVWDFAGTPADRYPLLLHYHPLTIYRHQVLKQADVVLAGILQPGAFTADQLRDDFDYYDPLTTGDSTLSASAQAIAAAALGRSEVAAGYFRHSLYVDLDDSHHNTSDGVHVAAAASVWSMIATGFAGLRVGEQLTCSPRLPAGWERLRFRVCHRGVRWLVAVEPDRATITRLSDASPRSFSRLGDASPR